MNKIELEKLVNAVIEVESAGNPNAVSRVGAQGLMQLMPATAQELFDRSGYSGEYDPFDPEMNKFLGTMYLEELLHRYDDDVKLALIAYNWGMGHLGRLIKERGTSDFEKLHHWLPDETQQYVYKVTKILERGPVQ